MSNNVNTQHTCTVQLYINQYVETEAADKWCGIQVTVFVG